MFQLWRWYAADGARTPGRTPVERFCHGAAQVVVALRHLARDKALRKAALLPTVLSLGGAAAIAALAIWIGISDGDDSTPQKVLHHFATVFIGLASLPPTLLHPLWVKLAREARTSLGLPPGHTEPKRGYLRVIWGEAKKGIKQAMVGGVLGLLPLIILVAMLPGSHWLKLGLIALWALYWIVVDAFELPFELSNAPMPRRSAWFVRAAYSYGNAGQWWSLKVMRRFGKFLHKYSRPWRREIAFTERNAEGVVGFSLALGTMLAVPVLGLLIRPVAIVAATQLAAIDPEFRRGEHQPGSTLPAHAEVLEDQPPS